MGTVIDDKTKKEADAEARRMAKERGIPDDIVDVLEDINHQIVEATDIFLESVLENKEKIGRPAAILGLGFALGILLNKSEAYHPEEVKGIRSILEPIISGDVVGEIERMKKEKAEGKPHSNKHFNFKKW